MRLVVGVPMIVVGLIFLFCGIAMIAIGPEARAGGIVITVFGLTIASLGKVVAGKRSTSDGEHWRDGPATNKQKTFARELGIKFPANINKGDLSDLISERTGD